MLKGVNKSVVEVVDIESEYFEKAILFLRPGRGQTDEGLLRRKAMEYLGGLRYRPRRKRTGEWLLIGGLVALGLVLGAVVWVILTL